MRETRTNGSWYGKALYHPYRTVQPYRLYCSRLPEESFKDINSWDVSKVNRSSCGGWSSKRSIAQAVGDGLTITSSAHSAAAKRLHQEPGARRGVRAGGNVVRRLVSIKLKHHTDRSERYGTTTQRATQKGCMILTVSHREAPKQGNTRGHQIWAGKACLFFAPQFTRNYQRKCNYT